MDIEVFSLCDFAQDFGGRLTVIGTFDSISTKTVPIVYPICHIATRIRFENVESGSHNFTVFMVDEDGHNVIPEIRGEMNVVIPKPNMTNVINLIVGLGQIKFKKTGKYSIDLIIDGRHEKTLPLTILGQPSLN